jgi:hypothetical protein
MRISILARLGIGLVVLMGLAGCRSPVKILFCPVNLPFTNAASPIAALKTPAKVDCVVRLRGVVGDRVPLIEAQVYQLQDRTDTIWVLTDNTTRQSGAEVYIKGIVRFQSVPINGKETGEFYIEEQRERE